MIKVADAKTEYSTYELVKFALVRSAPEKSVYMMLDDVKFARRPVIPVIFVPFMMKVFVKFAFETFAREKSVPSSRLALKFTR